jgi:mannitol/fructose-specific phosphotransferase system IIA component (Ntr-type)
MVLSPLVKVIKARRSEHFLSPQWFGFYAVGRMAPSTALALSDLLSPATIILSLASSERDGVLEELVWQIPELKSQPEGRATLLRALRERERLHSTGIGDGVALPHARNALVGLVNHPVVVFGRHARGLPYDAIDRAPARLFFLAIAPTVTQHLAILARLTRVLRESKLRKALLNVSTEQGVIELIREAETKL